MVLDSLSYYQFVILKVVVGEQRINEALAHNNYKEASNI